MPLIQRVGRGQRHCVLREIDSQHTAARVCFVEGEDNFTILSYSVPTDGSWRKGKDGGTYTTGHMISTFKRYKDGIESESNNIMITWQKFSEDGDWYADGKGNFGGDTSLSISPEEIDLKMTWTNKIKTITTFQLSIRVATGRFRQSYDSKDEKGKLLTSEDTGHCVRYENGLPEAPHPQ